MKRKFTFLIAAAVMLLTMMAQPGRAWGQAPVNTLLWEETWGTFTSQVTPSNYNQSGTTVYNNATVTYTQSSTSTKLYNETLAGGTTPELLLYKNNTTWTISGIPTGGATGLTLTFKANYDRTVVSSESTGITIGTKSFSNKTVTYPITVDANVSTFALTFTNTNNANVRIDNISLVVTTAGGGGDLEDSDLAITDAPVALVFDMNNNSAAQTVSYTTSSTGAITISPATSDYFTLVHDTGNKTITVTPLAVTPSAQTVTINQAPDATYAAGSAEFTVSITNSAPQYTVTYKANGGTGDDIPVQYYAGDDVTVAENTFTYAGHAFIKWNTNEGGTGTDYLPNATIENIQANIDLYAQWEESSETVDILNLTFTGITGGSGYGNWSGKEGTSGAVYSGNSAGGSSTSNPSIQLRTSNSNSGIVSTTSGGKVTKVEVTWNSSTSSGRKLDIYGKNSAYTAATDLYGDNAGTLIGSITCGNNNPTVLTISGDYEYIGMRSNNNAIYLNEIRITWEADAPTSDPSITANNVNIAYNATEGSIEYTVNNPVSGGALTATTTAEWLTLGTVDETTVPFTCTANALHESRTATVTLTYTYGTKSTVTKDVTITQAAAPIVYTSIPALFAAATTTETNVLVTFNNWVVSGVSTNGKNIFVTDNNGKGFVIYYTSDMSGTFAAGNVLSGTAVSCTLKLYNGFAELLNVNVADLTITDGGTVTETSIDMATLAGVNTGALLHYDNLTCSVTSDKYYLSDGTTTLQVFNSLYAFEALENGKTYNITGIYQQYNTTKEILPRSADDIEEVVPTEPTITVQPATVSTPFTDAEGTLTVTYENITTIVAEVYFCDANGDEATYNWIAADINNDNNVYYFIDANDGEARTAYFKVYEQSEGIYSNLVTVIQEEYVAPTYAELPFSFDGGKADIEDTDGLSQEGLGSDYSSSPKLKFDGTGDWLLLQFQERPGTLTFNIKNNSFSGGTFTVQTSEDGVTYTDLQAYTEITGTQNEEFTNLGENVRYIKWIYTEKSNGNVGLGNIVLAAYTAPVAAIILEEYAISAPADGTNGSMTVTLENMTISDVDNQFSIDFFHSDGSDFEPGEEKPDWVHAEFTLVNNVYSMNYTVDDNQLSTERNAYFKVYGLDDDGSTDAYSELVTVTQDGYVAPVAAITLEEYAISAPAAETEGTLTVTLENMTITNVDQFSIDFFHQDGSEFEPGEEKPDWVHADFTLVNNVYSMNYTVDANTEATERNAYFKVYGLDDDGTTDAYSELVTVTQAGYVVDYATLPFEWEGGSSADFSALNGVTLSGNGSDYGSTHAPYLIKLDSDGDYIMVKTNSQPGIVTIGVKMIGGGNTSTITVQGSADGESFTDIEELTISGNQNDVLNLETTNDFATTDRYVRLYFNKGSNVGVGPITIAQVDLTPSITVAPATLNLNCDGGDGELTVTHKNLADDPQLAVIFVESDGETQTTCDWIQASINAAGNVAGHINANTGEARTAYLKVTGRDAENNLIKSNLVTFNQAAYTEPSIVFETTTLDIVAGGENRTMSFDYEGLGQNPTFSINFYESDGTTAATYPWLTALITPEEKVDITVSANEGAARSAYFKVSGVNGEVNALSNLVTINQAAYTQLATYSLVTSVDDIVSGKHYIIASSATDGAAYAMGGQTTNNRSGVAVTIENGQIAETENVYEFVINTHESSSKDVVYTIYDAVTPGFLYASSSSANQLKTTTTLNDNGKWAIEISSTGAATITAQGSNSRKLMRYNPNNNNPIFACYATNTTTGNAPCLYVKDNDIDLEYYGGEVAYPGNSIPDGGSITVGAGSVMTVPDYFFNNDPAVLVIQDGGQLVHESPVVATVEKGTTAPSTWKANEDAGWYLIATPAESTEIATAFTGTFDLYKYSEPDAMWYTWTGGASTFDNITRGNGYLHASQTGETASFAGEMIGTESTLTKYSLSYAYSGSGDNMKGFNLVGNPFTRNLTKGDMTLGGEPLTKYYVINDAQHSKLTAVDDDSYEIKPGEGFFVQATAANQDLVFNPTTKGMNSLNNGYIKIVAGNEDGTDNAYIQLGNGNTLRKMDISNKTSVYVINEGDDYAAARVEELAGSMLVNFKAAEDGEYTITVNAKNIEAHTMILFDDFTGETIDLLETPSYTFTASVNDSETRFKLIFDFNTYTGIGESYTNGNFAYQAGDEILLSGEGTLQVFDVMGRYVASYEVNGSKRISTSLFNAGVYIFKMTGEKNMTQKIVVR